MAAFFASMAVVICVCAMLILLAVVYKDSFIKYIWGSNETVMNALDEIYAQIKKQPIEPKRVIVYYPDWAVYGRRFFPWDMDWYKITHVQYAFLNIIDNKAVLYDPWADETMKFSNLPGYLTQCVGPDCLNGCLGSLMALKKIHRKVKVMASCGGWTLSMGLLKVTETSEAMDTFVKSCVDMCAQYGLDGIDLDLEENEGVVINAKNYAELIKRLRLAMKAANSKYETSIALQCGDSLLEKMKPYFKQISNDVDNLSLMTYDFAGSWSKTSGHQSNLYDASKESGLSAKKAVDTLLLAGVDNRKICIGVPLYSRDMNASGGLHKPFTGMPPRVPEYAALEKEYEVLKAALPPNVRTTPEMEDLLVKMEAISRENGVWDLGLTDYKRLPKQGQFVYWDAEAASGYAYDPVSQVFSTYDVPEAVDAKCRYVKDWNLGGIIFWEADGDKSGSDSLVGRTFDAFAPNVDQKQNNLYYPVSTFSNVKNA